MPEQGTKPQQGTVLMGIDPATGTAYFCSIDPLTGNLLTQLATTPTITLGSVALLAGTAKVGTVLVEDQDLIFDHTNGTKTSVTTSATVLTPPAGCKFARITSDVAIYVNTAGAAAVDDGTSTLIPANTPTVIPVVAATAVKALSSSGTAVVRVTPMKARP